MLSTKDKEILNIIPLNIKAIEDLAILSNEWKCSDIALMVGIGYAYGEMQGKRQERARRRK